MQKGTIADRTDFTVAEKATHGNLTEVLLEDAGVEVGLFVEMLTAREAGEEEGTRDDVGLG